MDEELEAEMRKDLEKRLKGKNKVPFIFFSSASMKKIDRLKDMLWEQIKRIVTKRFKNFNYFSLFFFFSAIIRLHRRASIFLLN